MTYILIGPGLRDNVTLENLFPLRTVEQTGAIAPTRAVQERESSSNSAVGSGAPSSRGRQASQSYEEVQEPHERVKAVVAEQIMSSPVRTLGQEASIAEAWETMLAHSFRHLPVIESDSGHLVGMLSEHDFIHHAQDIGGLPPRPLVDARIQSVHQLMSSPILSATVDTELHELSRVMYSQNIGAMPILASEGRLVGIITHKDILKSLIKTEPLELWI